MYVHLHVENNSQTGAAVYWLHYFKNNNFSIKHITSAVIKDMCYTQHTFQIYKLCDNAEINKSNINIWA